jgi:hypothetical protein
MNSQTSAALILSLLLVGLGCQASHVDKHWGEAYRAAVARQLAEPEAAAVNADEPAPQGLDGVTAEEVVGKYHKDQAAAASSGPPTSLLLSTGN